MEPVLAAIAQLGKQLRGELAQQRGEITRLRVDVMDRLDRQQDTLSRIKDDINVNIAATDKVRDTTKHVRDDYDQLAHQLSLFHRRLIELEHRFDTKENGA